VSSGMKDAGYQYVNLDDGYGTVGGKLPKANPKKFPHGMKALADYIHSKGLKFGMYARGVPEDVYKDMVNEFVEWGVDYLKYDSFCIFNTEKYYLLLRQLLADSGRPIFYSISFKGHNPFVPGLVGCEGSYAHNPSELPNAWRTGSDLHGKWVEVIRNLDQQVGFANGHGLLHTVRWIYPGYWSDPDIMEVGNPGLTVPQSRSMFSLWCILSAPLLAGNDLRNMDDTIRDILTNREAIMVNQDPRGIPGRLVARDMKTNSWQVWAKPLIPGPWERWEPYDRQQRVAVVLFNRSDTKTQRITAKWTAIGLDYKPAVVRDVWQHKDLGVFENSFSASVKPCDVVMVTISTIGASQKKK
ncbi:MAG: glycoside hydrolase family 27 protein, partial [Planctomycetes bacterium]|nr:glycoside hydrolase family 27 protein [Planctomycetota bacterium]